MGRQLRLVHHTGYRYAGTVSTSHNEVRMTPRSTRDQFVHATRLDITPVAWAHSFVDYWGTQVTSFEVSEPHSELTVVATSTVEVGERAARGRGVDWAGLRSDAFVDQNIEMLTVTDHVDPGAEVRKLAAEVARGSELPWAAAAGIVAAISDRVAYVPGSTEVNTRASVVWERKAGVCQDLVHLSLGALRSVGIPARYVSGYVMPASEPVIGEVRVGESHAWLQYWDGEWVGLDPTNGVAPGEFHVEIGVGRDYFDVPPLRGVYSGSGASQLFVEVEMTLLS